MLVSDRLSAFNVRRLALIAILGLATLLAGCASRQTTGSVSKSNKPLSQMTMGELKQTNEQWAARYKKNPKNKAVGMNYATTLRMVGRNEQALAVMQEMAIKHSKDQDVLAAYGKALAGAGQLKKALNVVQRAQRPDQPDWRLHSAAGAIMDQLGNPKLARVEYEKALDLRPNEPSVLSNMGMSYLLTGNLKQSESYLRKAINQRNADSRVRQNLALVIGLQGRFKEAETVAAGELPPEQAQQNVAFLRQMLSEQNSWQQLRKEG